MGKRVFISHASADERIVSIFVDFILHDGCGVELEDIMYTTGDDTGIPNGEDIPSTIKESIRECRLFIMMVSPNYRKSEVCLNEMGAAWMCDGVKKIILLLPSVDFDRMGWLISLQKATKLTDARGLDQIHDQIVASLSTKVQTSTWNRYKAYFLKQLEEIPADAPDNVDMLGETTELSQLDVLGLSEKYALHSTAYVELLTEFTSAMNTYTGQLNSATQRIKNYNHNPQLFTATQLQGIFKTAARNTDSLSAVYEVKTSILRYHFDQSVKYALVMRERMGKSTFDGALQERFLELKERMSFAYERLKQFRETLDDVVGFDKTFKMSVNRLKIAMDNMLSVVSFCISRTAELA